jgi:DNA (cytosine-5)-methyltransferase 1
MTAKKRKPISYNEPMTVCLNDFVKNDFDKAIISHWLHAVGTPAEKFYKREASKRIPADIFNQYAHGIGNLLEEARQITFFPEVFGVPFPPPERSKFTFIDLFAGIGGIRLGFQALGGKCVFSSEWDEGAVKTYEANFGETPFGDITQIPVRSIPDFDILLAGFPCQPFSIIGDKEGFEHETQGTLFFNIEKILREKKPAAFMLENVRNLVAHDGGKTFKVILSHLEGSGYLVFHKVLNALDYGVPQKRERIIICGFRRPTNFEFPPPIPPDKRLSLQDILERGETIDKRLYVRKEIRDSRLKRLKTMKFPKPYLSHENVAGSITPHSYSCALRAGASANYILVNDERRPTERELLRIQGFPDDFRIVVNYSQIKRQTGNSVAVPMIKAVAEKMIQSLFGGNTNG